MKAYVCVYDVRGRKVRELVDVRGPGAAVLEAAWDLRDGEGHAVPAGAYFVRLQTPVGRDVKTVFVVR